MALHRVVGTRAADRPHLGVNEEKKGKNSDGAVERNGREVVAVLGIELHCHDVVGVALETLRSESRLNTYAHHLEIVVPIPHLDQHVVSAR